MAEKCKECGCKCTCCGSGNSQHNDMHLHAEIENLHQRLLERDNHIVTMETQFLNEADKFPNGELATIKEEILTWQEKYSRLYEAHKRVQKVNQNLEDKLLKIVDKCETEKSAFTKDIATLSHRLADANYTIHRLTQDNEKYRNDVNLAIQLLQCKPSNFIGQKYDSLPSEVQAKVRTYVAQKQCPSEITPDIKSITVPISTFPPTAMVYNVTKPPIDKHSDDDSDDSKPPVDIVSAAIMAKVLQDRERDRIFAKHCDTCACHKSILMVDAETQTTNSLSPLCCNECTTLCAHHGEKQADNIHLDKKSHSKDNQNTVVSCVFQETNENVSNVSSEKVRFYHNNNCTKHTNCQFLCTKGKVIRNARSLEPSKEDSRTINVKSNLHKKISIHHNDVSVQNTSHNYSGSITKQKVLQNPNDIPINRASNDKIKQAKISNKSDSHLDLKSKDNSWNKLDKKSTAYNNVCENAEKRLTGKEQKQIDIINDRLWKNEWTKLRTQTNSKGNMNRKRDNSDIEIDVINDRDWRKDRTGFDTSNSTQFTLIEVKSVDNVTSQTDCTQTEVTISPSYSTDSIIISTSDPSSSASDVVNSVTGTKLKHNISNVKSNGQRFSGPRNCFVRVTPGSKNILLDNAGHYKTVLYTSGSNKPNTALVHSKKTSRSGSERSASTNSEDSSLVLLHDNNHLQRVAEWVQSSVCMETVESDDSKTSKFSENNINEIPNSSVTYVNEKKSQFEMHSGEGDFYCNDAGNKHDTVEGHKESLNENSLSSDVSTLPYSSDTLNTTQHKEKDLITFDVPLESENQVQNVHESDTADINYEVKVTKEMEETYLKLAASLDPVALSLSTSKSMDLTIERYRKDYKKLHIQRCQDKMGSKTSGSS